MMHSSRRRFLKASGYFLGGLSLCNFLPVNSFAATVKKKIPVSGHLWVYASNYPPDWDCTPILDQVFADLKYAGLDGLELMEVNLRHEDAVAHINSLIAKYKLPVTGTSYSGDMWNKEAHQKIMEDVELVVSRLHAVGGTTFGITVGDAGHVKTEEELDAQAAILKRIIPLCASYKVEPNLHNHTFEVTNGLHDLKGTLARIPDIKLGPDLNWLVRAGVDPVWFINTYGHQIAYMHIRDQDAQGKWTEAVGEGVTNFPAIAKALNDINYQGRAAIELAFDKPATHPLKEDWKESRQYVKKVFGW